MSNQSLLKTSTTEKYYKNDIEQSQCQSSISEQAIENVHRTKSQIIIPDLIYAENFKRKSVDGSPTLKKQLNLVGKKIGKGFRIYRKIKKNKKKNQSDYRKNICGYITKKVIRQFTSCSYYQKVRGLCSAYKCDYNEAKNFYSSKVERVTGPSHIPDLLIPQSQSQKNFKRVFTNFFNWFLNERYLRYLLVQGKMSDKRAYIEYKNNTLLPLIQQKISQCPEDYKNIEIEMEQKISQAIEIDQKNEQKVSTIYVSPLNLNLNLNLNLINQKQKQKQKQKQNECIRTENKINTTSMIHIPIVIRYTVEEKKQRQLIN